MRATIATVVTVVLALLIGAPAQGHDGLREQISGLTAQLTREPARADLYLQRGELHRTAGDLGRARTDLDRASALDASLAGLPLAWARLHLDEGHPSDAVAAATRGLKAHPSNIAALRLRAQAYVHLHQRDLAVADLTSVTDLALPPAGAPCDEPHTPCPAAALRRPALLDGPRHHHRHRAGSEGGHLTLNVLRDDGAVVYINGTEVFRTNMPTGTVGYGTLATTAVSGADETTTFYAASVNPSVLQAGANVMAVELHQSGGTSGDVSFDAELIGSTSLQITRGPYLQMGTPDSIAVRWRTGAPSNSLVMYGPDPANLLWSASSATLSTEHELTLPALTPGTRYCYAVGSTTQTLAGDATHYFVTAPSTGTAQPARIWVLGDSGTADANARAVRDAFYGVNGGSTWANLWLMLGDNAYNSGTDAEFQSAVFDMYPATLRQSVLWPTIGNHDGTSADSATGTGPYYDIFSLPKAAQAGGLASGTEAYYSFDYGDIHFICLDSFETSRATNGAMLTWLQNDLASTSQKWIIAFWNHPPYSKGSHDSDTDTAMSQMRQNALPILEAGGVDLVLAGHSHSYERSYLLDGHYGVSTTLTATMTKKAGSGREDGTGAYLKPTGGKAPHEGTVYGVAGSSGQISGGTLNHPAMFVSMNVLGSMVLDLQGDRLDARFIDNTGATRDYFTIRTGAAPVAVTTTTLPGATVGVPYNQALSAVGGTTPYLWSLPTGSLTPGPSTATTRRTTTPTTARGSARAAPGRPRPRGWLGARPTTGRCGP